MHHVISMLTIMSPVVLAIPLLLFAVLRNSRSEGRKPVLVFAAAALFATVLVWEGLQFYTSTELEHNMQECQREEPREAANLPSLHRAQRWAACVDGRNGLLEGLAFRNTRDMLRALPAVPCRYVGIWSVAQPGARSKYRITLTDDSKFVAEPLQPGTGDDFKVTGYWGVHEDNMIWIYDHGAPYQTEIKPLRPESRGRFDLIDVNGAPIRYEMIDAIKSNTCIP